MRLLGYLDHLGADGIYGWAVDQDREESPVLIDASSNGELKFSLFSALPREDVSRMGTGKDRSGFFGNLPDELFDGSSHQLQFGSEIDQLNRSPVEFCLSARTFTLDHAHSAFQRLRSELTGVGSPIDFFKFTLDSSFDPLDTFTFSPAVQVARECCSDKTVIIAETRGRSLFKHSVDHIIEAGLNELVIRSEGDSIAADVFKWNCNKTLATRWVRSCSADLEDLNSFLVLSVEEAIESGSRCLEIEAKYDPTLYQRAPDVLARALLKVKMPLAVQFSWKKS